MTLEINKIQCTDSPEMVDFVDNEEENSSNNEVQTADAAPNIDKKEENYVDCNELSDDTSVENLVQEENEPVEQNQNDAQEENIFAGSENMEIPANTEDYSVTKEEFQSAIFRNPEIKSAIEEYGVDEAFKIFDKDNDGKITSEEIKELNSSCEKLEDFTLGEIKKLLADNSSEEKEETKQEEKDDADEAEKSEALKSENKSKTKTNKTKSKASNKTSDSGTSASSGSSSSSVGSSGSYSSGGSSGYSGSSGGSSSSSKTKESSGETVEELEAEKKEKETSLSDLNSSLKKVQSGEDAEISDKKTNMDNLEKEYKELLEKECENNSEVKEIKDEIEEQETNIKEHTTKIDETEIKLNETKQSISTKNSEIEGYKLNKSALQTDLDAAKAIKITDSNKESIQSKISSLESLIQAEENKITKAEGELEKLNTTKTSQEKEIETLKEEKEGFETTRNEKEKELENKVSEKTKEALEKYQTARTTYENAKSERLKTVQSDIETTQTEISGIEKKISALKAEALQKENAVSGFGQYNAQRGEALVASANALYGSNPYSTGLCATGVSNAIYDAFGYRTSGNGCDYANVLSQRDDWAEVTDSIESLDDLMDLSAGAVVSWEPYNTTSAGSIYGHVYIADGEGNEISDFKAAMNNEHYMNGGGYRVFVPI